MVKSEFNLFKGFGIETINNKVSNCRLSKHKRANNKVKSVALVRTVSQASDNANCIINSTY